VTTDAQGRFLLHGIGKGAEAGLNITQDQSAPQSVKIKPDEEEELRVSLTPARILSVRVVYGDTRQPVPGARVSISWSGGPLPTEFRADANGRVELRPHTGQSFYLRAFAPAGEPYLGRSQEFSWPEGVVRDVLDIALPHGALVRGTITDAESGKPIAGALVGWWAQRADNPHWKTDILTQRYSAVASKPDGTFQVGVLPGPGVLMVQGGTPDYIHQEIFWDRRHVTYSEKPIGWRMYPDGWTKLDLKPGEVKEGVNLGLHRGVTLEGRLVGPQGEPVDTARMASRLNVLVSNVWAGPVDLYGGRFCIRGCDPSASHRVFFLDTQHQWGAAVSLSAKEAGSGPLTVRLAPCGSAKARLVDTRGQPLKNFPPGNPLLVELVVTPGSSFASESGPVADTARLSALDPKSYGNLRSDRDGRCILSALIPGATYRIGSGIVPAGGDRMTFEKDFTVKSGQVFDLSDLPLERYRISP
jgi:hypothetical protein